MIDRRTLVSGLAACLLAAPGVAVAQPVAKRPRIGVLANLDNPEWQGFRQGLSERGYVDGRNATVDWRWSEGRTERLPALAIELVALEVDVIVASGTQAAQAAKQASRTIPIVLALSSYPDRMGLVESLAHPGGNVTGLTSVAPELMGKRLQFLQEIVPSVRRVAVLHSASQIDLFVQGELRSAAAVLGLQIQSIAVPTPGGFTAAFAAVESSRAQAVMAVGSPVIFTGRQQIVEFALASRIASVFDARLFVETGGLLSYAPNFTDMFRRAAGYVDRILKGAKPADLPVEQPTKFELVINLKTAKVLGLTIPQSLLLRADEVIE